MNPYIFDLGGLLPSGPYGFFVIAPGVLNRLFTINPFFLPATCPPFLALSKVIQATTFDRTDQGIYSQPKISTRTPRSALMCAPKTLPGGLLWHFRLDCAALVPFDREGTILLLFQCFDFSKPAIRDLTLLFYILPPPRDREPFTAPKRSFSRFLGCSSALPPALPRSLEGLRKQNPCCLSDAVARGGAFCILRRLLRHPSSPAPPKCFSRPRDMDPRCTGPFHLTFSTEVNRIAPPPPSQHSQFL